MENEWEKSCSISPGYLLFDGETRSLRVKVEGAQETRIIVIRFSNISRHSIGRDAEGRHSIFFALQTPPHFESEEPEIILNLFTNLQSSLSGIARASARHFATISLETEV